MDYFISLGLTSPNTSYNIYCSERVMKGKAQALLCKNLPLGMHDLRSCCLGTVSTLSGVGRGFDSLHDHGDWMLFAKV